MEPGLGHSDLCSPQLLVVLEIRVVGTTVSFYPHSTSSSSWRETPFASEPSSPYWLLPAIPDLLFRFLSTLFRVGS